MDLVKLALLAAAMAQTALSTGTNEAPRLELGVPIHPPAIPPAPQPSVSAQSIAPSAQTVTSTFSRPASTFSRPVGTFGTPGSTFSRSSTAPTTQSVVPRSSVAITANSPPVARPPAAALDFGAFPPSEEVRIGPAVEIGPDTLLAPVPAQGVAPMAPEPSPVIVLDLPPGARVRPSVPATPSRE
jgi:hypothetical protein